MIALKMYARAPMLRAVGASSLVLAIAGAWPAMAQESPQSMDKVEISNEALAQTIIITGSRIARRGFDAPSPVTVLNQDDIQKLGLINTSDVVSQLPQNSSFVSSANVGAGNFNIGASLANLRGLNPFFGTRTLTLVDTKRFVPTTDGGAVDLNIIPSMLVSRVETVTGGSSAAYGSDAIAGVVNIILDTRLSGLKAQIDAGANFQGDGASRHVSAAWGHDLAGGRGHFVVGAEYEDSDPIGGCALVREWCSAANATFTNSGNAPTPAGALFPGSPAIAANGLPHYVIGPNSRGYNSLSGLFPLSPLGPVQVNPAGTAIMSFVPGTYANIFAFPALMQGGADATQLSYKDTTLRPKVERFTSFAHLAYNVSDALEIYVQGAFAQRRAINVQANSGASVFSNTIYRDNVFLPGGAATAVSLGLPSYPSFSPFGNFSSDGAVLPAATNNTRVRVGRGVLGAGGGLTATWTWDAYFTYGRNETRQRVANTKVVDFFNFALDAVDNPATSAIDPTCRQVLLGNVAAAGCVPLNLFGVGKADPSAIAYAFRTLAQDTVYEQQVASGNIRGELFDGWGSGPINAAAGAEYRRETIVVTHNLAEQPYYFNFERGYGGDYSGKSEVVEGFLELNVPVLLDAPGFKALIVDGAVRQTHNKSSDRVRQTSSSTDFTTWKVNAIWDVTDWLRFRGTKSRDVRAPSFYENFSRSTVVGGFFGTVTNPVSALPAPFNQQQATVTLGGDAGGLKPEEADTVTAGVVLTGRGVLSGLRASVDWYEVKLTGPISSLGGGQAVINACFNQQSYCNLIGGTGPTSQGLPGTITTVQVPNLNLGLYQTRGLDFELGYNFKIAAGDVGLRLIGSYLYDMIIDPGTGAPRYNYAGVSGPTDAFGYFNTSPKWQGNAVISYGKDGFTGTIQARYVGPGKFKLLDSATGLPLVAPGEPGYDPTLPNSISSNHVDSAIYVNLSLSQRIAEKAGGRWIEIFGTVNNLFDKTPPVAPGGNGYPTNPVYFDTFGASFRAGARIRY